MTGLYLIYIPDVIDTRSASDSPVQWLQLSMTNDEAVTGSSWQHGTLGTLPAADLEMDIHVVISAAMTTPVSVDLPARQCKHLAQLLPYVIEDRLATDVEQLHLAHYPPRRHGDSYQIDGVVLGKPALDALLKQLNRRGLDPCGIYLDCLCLPVFDDVPTLYHCALSACYKGVAQCLLRWGSLGASLDANNLELMLSSLHRQAPFGILHSYCDPGLSGNEAPDVALAVPKGVESANSTISIEKNSDYPLTHLIAQSLSKQENALNLLQGTYTPQGYRHTSPVRWRMFAAAVGILLSLNVIYNLFSGWYFINRAEALYHQSETLYREYFPSDKRIVDIRQQVEQHLSSLDNAIAAQGFLPQLRIMGKAWRDANQETLHIRQIRFDHNTNLMTLDIGAATLNSLDQLQWQLRDVGLEAELLSTDSAEEGVRGRLQITQRSPEYTRRGAKYEQ